MDFGEMDMRQESIGSVGSLSLTQRLQEKKKLLEAELNEVKAALLALEKNPELQALIDMVSKVRC